MPPFSKQRRNTVYDLTALRIHHDDFRIPSSDSNYRYRRDKKITKDVRGNWIAKDAGGTGKIPWYTKVDGGKDEDEEDGEDMEVEKDEDEEGEGNTEKEDEGGSSEDEEYRRGQRRRFYEDMSYLDDHVDPQQPSGSMPVPDSDLLKTIHYFASVYYSDIGQLYDSQRRAAQLKKRKRMQEEDSPEPSGEEGGEDEDGEGALEPEIEDEDQEQDEEDWIDEDVAPTGDEDESDEEGSQPRKRQAISKGKGKERDEGRSVTNTRRKARRGKKRVDRDWAEVHRNQNMYRRFDGSALMALGMLVQEFVKENIGPPLPVRRNPKKEEGGHELPDKPTESGDARMEDQEEDDEERTSDEGEESPTVVGVDDYDDSDSDDE